MPTQRRYRHRRYKRPNRGFIVTRHTVPSDFKVANFVNCAWIQGGTLKRYMLQENKSTPTKKYFYVRTPSHRETTSFCDACIRQHKDTNYMCSFTRGLDHSYAKDSGEFYDFKTRQKILSSWTLVGKTTFSTSRVSEEIYELV